MKTGTVSYELSCPHFVFLKTSFPLILPFNFSLNPLFSSKLTDFCDAGVRYYDKLLNKNIAIRELSGQDLYTAKGNVHFLLREKCLPLTVRKKYFELKLKEYQVKQEQASDIAADITEPTVQIKNQTWMYKIQKCLY